MGLESFVVGWHRDGLSGFNTNINPNTSSFNIWAGIDGNDNGGRRHAGQNPQC